MAEVVLEDGSRVPTCPEPVGAGASGTGYLSTDRTRFIKLFHSPSPHLEAALRLIVGKYNATRDSDPARVQLFSGLFTWPTAIVRQPSLGIVAPALPSGMRMLFELVAPGAYRRLPPSAKSWEQRVRIAWHLAAAVDRLHSLGLAHSDLSHFNVMVDPIAGRVSLIDVDSLVVPGFAPPQVLGTPGYVAPEVLAGRCPPSIDGDKHALSVLLYQLLLFAHPLQGPFDFGLPSDAVNDIEALQLSEHAIYAAHPTDHRNRPPRGFYPPAILGATIEALFLRTFTTGLRDPASRPQAHEWSRALSRLTTRLVSCSRRAACAETRYPLPVGREPRCPWCQAPLQCEGGLPVLHLYETQFGGRIAPAPDFMLVGAPGRSVPAWVARADLRPTTAEHSVAEFREVQGAWRLRNVNCPGLAVFDGQGRLVETIGVGEELKLVEGSVLRFGPPGHSMRHAKVAKVAWTK